MYADNTEPTTRKLTMWNNTESLSLGVGGTVVRNLLSDQTVIKMTLMKINKENIEEVAKVIHVTCRATPQDNRW